MVGAPGGILAEGGEETLDEIQEVGVGEDRQLTRRTLMAKYYVTDARGRDICLMYALIRHPLGTAPARTLSASDAASQDTFKRIARRQLHGVLTTMQFQPHQHKQMQQRNQNQQILQ